MRVAHLWQVHSSGCSSVYAVISPGRLAGTLVAVTETTGSPRVEITVRLLGSSVAVELGQNHVNDDVLGSEFVYDDLRILSSRATLGQGSVAAERFQEARMRSCNRRYTGFRPRVIR